MASTARVSRKSAPPPPNRSFLLIGGLAIVGAAILGYLVLKPKNVSIPVNATILEADTAGFRGYVLGSETAPVEISEYADYQCPACQVFETLQFDVVKRQLIDSGLVRWRYRDFPLDAIHRHARLAAHAAACANDQNKFWEMHRSIYHNQPTWSAMSSAAGFFSDLAKQVGLDTKTYDDCMSKAKYAGRIEASFQEGTKLGVPSTPTFLINGRLYPGVLSSDSLAAMVRGLIPKPETK